MPDLLPSVQARTGNDSVGFVLQVTNTADSVVNLTFPTGQSYDFVVLDDSGNEIWRWSEDRMFTQAIREESLAPGETLTYTAAWTPDPGTSGEFEVLGVLTAQGRDVRERTQFRVP